MVRSLLLAPLAVAAASAATLSERQSSCACGYKDSTGAVWRESFVSDFTTGGETGGASALEPNFFKMTEYHPAREPNDAPYPMQYATSNVYGHNYGLGIKTPAYKGGSTGTVSTGGINSYRRDIQYGTFRMRATVPSVPGVCFGFFTYKSDTQEADIEFLSSDPNYHQTLHHTNQPGLINGDTDPDASKTVVVSGADFTAFHEHRLDWLKGSSKYYYDGVLKSTVSKNSPTEASQILLNVWSNGGPLWTQGPPTQDAIATIYYVKAYFNSTTFTESQFNSQCAAAASKVPCSV